jgi:DNA-binding NarL/FixJ family response regulator
MPVSDKRIRILTVDDHPLLRDGIAALIEGQPDMELVGEAANGLEAIEFYREYHPDITLMDLQMPQMGGIDAMIAIRDRWSDAKVIVLTTYVGDVLARRALQAGARAYVLESYILDRPDPWYRAAADRQPAHTRVVDPRRECMRCPPRHRPRTIRQPLGAEYCPSRHRIGFTRARARRMVH